MTSIANQSSHTAPNVLRGGSAANTIGGVGLPAASSGLRRSQRTFVATASVVLAGLAIALLVWRST